MKGRNVSRFCRVITIALEASMGVARVVCSGTTTIVCTGGLGAHVTNDD